VWNFSLQAQNHMHIEGTDNVSSNVRLWRKQPLVNG